MVPEYSTDKPGLMFFRRVLMRAPLTLRLTWWTNPSRLLDLLGWLTTTLLLRRLLLLQSSGLQLHLKPVRPWLMNGSAQTLQEWEFDYFDVSVVVHVCCFAQTCLLQFKYISSLTCTDLCCDGVSRGGLVYVHIGKRTRLTIACSDH